MTTLQRNRLKSSRTDSQTENSSQTDRRRADHESDGLDLASEPTYDREYNDLLTLKEATER